MERMRFVRYILISIAFANVAVAQRPSRIPPETLRHYNKRHHKLPGNVPAGSTGAITPSITYGGGDLIAMPNIYFIWYGNWNQKNGSDTPAGKRILRDLALGIGGSPYYQINTTYSTPSYELNGSVGFGGETTDANSRGTRLDDSDVLAIVKNAITSNRLPNDPNGVYFVLSSSNVRENSGFCSKYCGWHASTSITDVGRIRYAFVGNARRCLSACAIQPEVSPNNNPGVDAMASIVAHELVEAATNPDLHTGWMDANGYENADKCGWSYGQNKSVAPNGSYYNMVLNGRKFLIQRNLKHAETGDTCNIDLLNQ